MHDRKLATTLIRAATLGASIWLMENRAQASPLPRQSFVQLQSSTPGTQQTGHSNISGTGIFGTALGIGTSSPIAGLHVNREAIPPGGTLALEGTTHTYMTFFPQGVGSGRKAYFGIPSSMSPNPWLTNEATSGHIVLAPGPLAGVGVNTPPSSYQMLEIYTAAPNGYAVFAESTYGSGSTYGVFCRSYSTSGFGVYSSPELYGQPLERGVQHLDEQDAQRP